MSTRREGKPSASAARHVADFVVLGLTLFVAWFLWPSFLGGSSRMITVQGHSMEPTYVMGDLVILDTDATPEVGNVIVFKIPDEQPGAGNLVVHRVIGERADGTYDTQGDNTASPDTFFPSRSDILGSPRISIPHGAQAIGLLSSPVGLATASGMLSTLVLWPRKKSMQPTAVLEQTIDADPTLEVERAIDEDGWSSTALSEQVIAEAEAWLESQLVSFGQAL